MADFQTSIPGSHPQPLSLEQELLELAGQIQDLLFLSEGDVSQAQLDEYSDRFTHILRYGRALGYHAAFSVGEDGGIAVDWLPILETGKAS